MTLPPQIERNRHLLSLALLGFLIIVGVAILVNLRNPQELRRRAAPPGTVDAQIQLTPSTDLNNLQVGNTFDINIAVRSGQNPIYGLDFVTNTFNTSVLRVQSIMLGSGVRNGCQSGSGAVPMVLAPVNSTNDCNFNSNKVINGDPSDPGNFPGANNSGVLEFGVAAFDWNSSSAPSAIAPSGNYTQVAIVRFSAIAQGTTSISVRADSFNGSATTDSNIVTVFNDNSVGDVLNAVNPSSLSVNVGGGTNACNPNLYRIDINSDGNIDFIEVMTYIAGYNCTFGGGTNPCNPSIPTSADGADGSSPNGKLDFLEIMLVVANYNCAYRT